MALKNVHVILLIQLTYFILIIFYFLKLKLQLKDQRFDIPEIRYDGCDD